MLQLTQELANTHADALLAVDPASLQECLVQKQFAEYVCRFPEQEARRRLQALTDFYPVKSTAEIVQEVEEALRTGRPYALMRLNDGEGSCLSLGLKDEGEFPDLYRLNRRNFHELYWFGHDRHLSDAGWLTAMRDFNDSLESADAVAAHHEHSLGEYVWGSVRNVPSIFNIVRKLEALQEVAEPGRIKLCHPQIHQQLLFEGFLDRLLNGQSRIGLVSAHPALPNALRRRFGLSEVEFHETQGEPVVGKESTEDFGTAYRRLRAELAQARPGMLYLVCAGVISKPLCEIIKRAGGVALDLGAVADIWMGVPSRGYYVDVAPFVLKTDGEEETRPAPPVRWEGPRLLTPMGPDRWWGEAEVRVEDPPVEVHEGAYSLPFRHGGQWGLFDAADASIEAAVDRFLPDSQLMGQDPTSYLRGAEITETLPEGDYLYGGRFNAHFGHYLVESISRLWPLAQGRAPGQKIIMHGDVNPQWWFAHPWVSDVFGGLGLSQDDFVHLDRPFRIPRVTIPHTSFHQQKYASQAYRSLCQVIGRRLLGDAPLVKNDQPVWLSKSRLQNGVRRVSNETEIEAELRANGVEVIYPEELSFTEKIRMFGTRTVCGSIMSAMHVTIFSPVAGRQIWLHPYYSINTNFILVDKLHDNDVVYLHPAGSHEFTKGDRFMIMAEIAEPRRVAAELLEMLNLPR